MDANPPANLPDDPFQEHESEEEKILRNFFTYHPPTEAEIPSYKAVNDAAFAFARVILGHVPPGPDRSAAIRQVREARMTANAGIACKGARLPY